MPRSTWYTTTVITEGTPATRALLGPSLIYYFQFAETAQTIAERYLALSEILKYPAALKFDVDTNATSWVFDPIPNAHNRFYIYKSRTPDEKHYQVLNAVKGGDHYFLAVEFVDTLESATVWTIEEGDRRNKVKISTIFPNESLSPIYWAVTKQGDQYVILVRDLGSNHREGEFVLEELNLAE